MEKTIAILALLATACTLAGCGSWDYCGGLYGAVCGCLGDPERLKVCEDAVDPYVQAADEGACQLALTRLQPMFCP